MRDDDMKRKIVLIGAGNLATNLGYALLAAGYEVCQVFSRTMESAEALAHRLSAEPVTETCRICGDADIYVFSVKDAVLEKLAFDVCRDKPDKVFLHTAGSMPMSLFDGVASHYGVLYPMQTFSKSKKIDFSEIPCFVEASDAKADEEIMALAHDISRKVYRLSSEDRKYLHLSAVFACNFVNHCYAISQDLLSKHGIPFDVMLPLVDETARKVHVLSPQQAQTGPAVRYDKNVIQAQSLLLQDNPLLQEVYEKMSLSIHRASGADSSDKCNQ